MDRSSDIRLDPNVAGLDGDEGGNSQTPLSDLYELPVFAPDTQERAKEGHIKDRQMLKQVRQEVFEVKGPDGVEERLWRIRRQIFREGPKKETSGLSALGQARPEASEIFMPGYVVSWMAAGVFLFLLEKRITCRCKKENKRAEK